MYTYKQIYSGKLFLTFAILLIIFGKNQGILGMDIRTRLANFSQEFDYNFGTLNPPIYTGSTFIFDTIEDYKKSLKSTAVFPLSKGAKLQDHSYGTAGTPTHFALIKILNELHGGDNTILTPSGLNAISLSLLSFLQAGDHLVAVDNIYGPNRRFILNELKKLNIEVTFCPPTVGADIKNYIKPNTKVIFLESPGSLTFEIQDVEAITKFAKSKKIITILDNSFSSPVYFRPLEWGVDVVIEAITKYIGGHSDILMGAIISNKATTEILEKTRRNYGVCVSAFDAWLALRGIRTLASRLDAQNLTLSKVLEYLAKHKKVGEILAPSHKKFVSYKLWQKYFDGAAPLFSIVLDKNYSEKQVNKFVNSLKVFGIGASWGGYKSLALPVDVSYRTFGENYKNKNIIRLYLGLESYKDIIADLEQGFMGLR